MGEHLQSSRIQELMMEDINNTAKKCWHRAAYRRIVAYYEVPKYLYTSLLIHHHVRNKESIFNLHFFTIF